MKVRNLGRVAYEPTWRAMQSFTAARGPDTRDEIWLVEHPPVFTLGLAGRAEHVLDAGEVAVVSTDRGGQVTYHGPGQAIAYVLLDLKRNGLGVKALVALLEDAAIALLAEHGIAGERWPGRPGVYVRSRKIAAIGLRVTRGCCYHGVAVNVDLPLEPFARIDPCGFPGLESTSLVREGARASISEVHRRLAASLEQRLAPSPVPA